MTTLHSDWARVGTASLWRGLEVVLVECLGSDDQAIGPLQRDKVFREGARELPIAMADDPQVAQCGAHLTDSDEARTAPDGQMVVVHVAARRKTSYSACVHAVTPKPRVRYSALKNTPATARKAKEASSSWSP